MADQYEPICRQPFGADEKAGQRATAATVRAKDESPACPGRWWQLRPRPRPPGGPGPRPELQAVRRAAVGGSRDARTAGHNPASAPIRTAAASPPLHAPAGITIVHFCALA